MADYKNKNTAALEHRALTFMQALGFNIQKNNAKSITSTDYICLVSGEKKPIYLDFQYSCNFSRYGDLRIDVISAYKHINTNSSRELIQQKLDTFAFSDATSESGHYENKELPSFFKQWLDIKKWGKVFADNEDHPKGLIYFIYNSGDDHTLPTKVPDIIYFVKTKELHDYILNNWQSLINDKRLKLNDKLGLGDSHGSAFFAVPLRNLIECKIGYTIMPSEIKNHTII